MNIKPIKTETDYNEVLETIDGLMDAKKDTPEGDMLDVLVTLVEKYENTHWAILPPDPIEAILFRMEQQGLSRKDIELVIGNKSKVSEVLNRTRPLSLNMIKRIHKELHIPFDSLIDCA